MTDTRRLQVNDRSADILDEASQLEAKTVASATAAIQKLTAPQSYRREDGTLLTQGRRKDGTWVIPECVDCEDEIHLSRLELGRIRCVVCQSIEEKHRGHY